MTYSELVEDLTQRIDSLPVRSKAAVFWLAGSGLLTAFEVPDEWEGWVATARDVGRKFITTGETDPEASALWERVGAPTDTDSHLLLNSVVICLSTPVGLAANPGLVVGAWVEDALFPVLQSVSLEMFDDVAFPGEDEELDQILATPRFQAAAEFIQGLVRQFAATGTPDAPTLEALVSDARVLAPSPLANS